jgi:hypothetical protein
MAIIEPNTSDRTDEQTRGENASASLKSARKDRMADGHAQRSAGGGLNIMNRKFVGEFQLARL